MQTRARLKWYRHFSERVLGGRKKTANLHFHFLTILKLLIVRYCNINIKLHIGLLPAAYQAFLHKPPQYPSYPSLLFLFCKGFLSFHLPPFLTNIYVDITIKKTCLLILRDSSPESMCSLASQRCIMLSRFPTEWKKLKSTSFEITVRGLPGLIKSKIHYRAKW